jgi:hypothetical protein
MFCQELDKVTSRNFMNAAPIHKEDLRALAEVGKALWMDSRESRAATLETLSAVALMDLTPERSVEKAARALLERVTSRGNALNTRENLRAGMGMGQAFYRMAPEERFLLAALHLGRWSYARIARILEQDAQQVEAQAWVARLKLLAQIPGVAYPAGASAQGPHCPEYDSHRPWTQRFLDEEISSGRERGFFQNHLMACVSCRGALARCREAYFAIERAIPREEKDTPIVDRLAAVTRQGHGLKNPTERTFLETLTIFTRRPDIRVVIALFALMTAWRLLRGN